MPTVTKTISQTGQSVSVPESNTVALIGAILVGVSVLLCGLLFWLVSQLPNGIEEFRKLENNTPTQMRLLILGCSTAVLTVVSMVLCLVGLWLPNRPRLLAALGTFVSGMILLGVFAVLVVGAVLNPGETLPKGQTTESVQAGN